MTSAICALFRQEPGAGQRDPSDPATSREPYDDPNPAIRRSRSITLRDPGKWSVNGRRCRTTAGRRGVETPVAQASTVTLGSLQSLSRPNVVAALGSSCSASATPAHSGASELRGGGGRYIVEAEFPLDR
jgi:hypothetical protein